MLAATDEGVYNSTDSGATWTSVAFAGTPAYAFATLADGSLLAGGDTGLLHATTAAGPWTTVRSGAVYALLVENGKVVAATDAGVFVSSDLATWTLVPGLETSNPNVFASDGVTLYVGTTGFGLFTTPLP